MPGGEGMTVGPMTNPAGQMSPASHGVIGGIPMKKKAFPKRPTRKLKQTGLKRRLYKSFEKFSTKGKHII